MHQHGDTRRVAPDGYLLECPHCRQELRVAGKYSGAHVECKLCLGRFRLAPGEVGVRLVGFLAECPHCLEELRVNWRYHQARVACKLCGGRIQFANSSGRPAVSHETSSQPFTPG